MTNGPPAAESPAEDIQERVEETARRATPWIAWTARAGYVAKGVIYAAVGILAARVALGASGKTTGTGGAVESIGEQPFGKVLLLLLAAGLLGYAFWKLVQGVMDPDDRGSGLGGLVRRAAYGGSALIHGGLAFSALEELFGIEGQSTSLDQWTAQVMAQPLGRWLVGLAGLGVVAVGLYQLYAGLTARFRAELKTYHMSEAARWATITGRVGTAARAVAILVAGGFVLLAAWQADPGETRGLGDALETMVRQPFGPYLLGAVAFGLVAYAAFMFLVARCRNIEAC